MSSSKVLLGLLAGVAVGAMAGILLAPDKGSRTRKNLAKKGTDFAEDLKDKFNEFIESITDQMEEVKDEAAEMVQKGKSKAEHATRQ